VAEDTTVAHPPWCGANAIGRSGTTDAGDRGDGGVARSPAQFFSGGNENSLVKVLDSNAYLL